MQRLVKAYQEEIDALAKRSRASDSAFFSLYKAIYEAPDPAQALERLASEKPRAAASEVRYITAQDNGGTDARKVSLDRGRRVPAERLFEDKKLKEPVWNARGRMKCGRGPRLYRVLIRRWLPRRSARKKKKNRSLGCFLPVLLQCW